MVSSSYSITCSLMLKLCKPLHGEQTDIYFQEINMKMYFGRHYYFTLSHMYAI